MATGGGRQSRGSSGATVVHQDRAGVFTALNVITGTNGDDILTGTASDDLIRPKLGYDIVDGGAGNDTLRVNYSRVSAGPGTHVSSFYSNGDGLAGFLGGGVTPSCEFSAIESLRFTSWDGDDSMTAALTLLPPGTSIEIDGGGGVNTLGLYAYAARPGGPMIFSVEADGTAVSNTGTFINFDSFFLLGGGGRDDLATGDGDDLIFGRKGDDVIGGGGGGDELYGGGGSDTLTGGDGDDRLDGQGGTDMLTGGSGADMFGFARANRDGVDRITDFSRAGGDRIDASAIDADRSERRDQAFTFIGDNAFTGPGGTNGELRAQDNGDGTFTVECDVNRDGVADFQLLVTASEPLVAGDFVL